MSIISIIIILAVIGIGFWLVWKYVPGIWKTVFLVAIGIIIIFFLLRITGLISGVGNLRI